MAFTPTQRETIRTYLGFPSAWEDLFPRLEGAMDTVGADSVKQTNVEAILTKIAAVDVIINSSGSSSSIQGALKAITGDVEWYSPDESGGSVTNAEDYGHILINRLAARFGFSRSELPSHYFGKGGGRTGEMALG